MKKPKKRYELRFELLVAIEDCQHRIRSLPRRNGDLGRLKAALGVFDTVPFDFIGSDKSVTA